MTERLDDLDYENQWLLFEYNLSQVLAFQKASRSLANKLKE